MRKIIAAGLGAVTALGLFVGPARGSGAPQEASHERAASQGRTATQERETTQEREVSRQQYAILLAQCRYADGAATRSSCRASVRQGYRVGRSDPSLDCRTYSGVTVCGDLPLSAAERACIRDAVGAGMTYRRSEVECYVSGG
jgi:hypothetical protein